MSRGELEAGGGHLPWHRCSLGSLWIFCLLDGMRTRWILKNPNSQN